uniref:Er-5 pheromone n=1 Tax=Euplotes raikovi TaxID=5938 RepID=A0A346CI61_EUPRA|nr:Er-5 pheromone [Euplotes raikovi]
MNKLAILAIIAMVLLSANAFRLQSRLGSNFEAKTETRDECESAVEQCKIALCQLCWNIDMCEAAIISDSRCVAPYV